MPLVLFITSMRRCLSRSLGLLILLSASGCAAATVPLEVLSAATNGLTVFLAKIPPGREAAYGFSNGLNGARLAGPVCLERVEESRLENVARSGTVAGLLQPMPMWFFPVVLSGEPRAMLVVDWQGGGWRAVSFGYVPLAREWGAVLRAWPADRGYHPRLAAAFGAARYCFHIPEVSDCNLTMLRLQSGAVAGARRDYRDLKAAGDTVTELRTGRGTP